MLLNFRQSELCAVCCWWNAWFVYCSRKNDLLKLKAKEKEDIGKQRGLAIRDVIGAKPQVSWKLRGASKVTQRAVTKC